MTKTIKKLEKEKLSWKTKFDNCNRSLLQMVEEVGHANFSLRHATIGRLTSRCGLVIDHNYLKIYWLETNENNLNMIFVEGNIGVLKVRTPKFYSP